jgi:hypothetical protein
MMEEGYILKGLEGTWPADLSQLQQKEIYHAPFINFLLTVHPVNLLPINHWIQHSSFGLFARIPAASCYFRVNHERRDHSRTIETGMQCLSGK